MSVLSDWKLFYARLKVEGRYSEFLQMARDIAHEEKGAHYVWSRRKAAKKFKKGCRKDELWKIQLADSIASMRERRTDQEYTRRQRNIVRDIVSDKIPRKKEVAQISYRDEVQWVFQNYPYIVGAEGEVNIDLLKSAPTSGAAGLMMWAAKKPDSFYSSLVPKVLGSSKVLERDEAEKEQAQDSEVQLESLREEIRRFGASD